MKTRRLIGAGRIRSPAQLGAVDSATSSWPTRSQPCCTKSRSSRVRAAGSRLLPIAGPAVPAPGIRRGENAGCSTIRSSLASIADRTAGSPHHQVAVLGSSRSCPSTARHRPGRKASRAAASTTPLPSALATTTVPPRTASSSPGMPRLLSLRSSSGSHHSLSRRRMTTSTGFSPSTAFRNTRPSRTVRSAPSTSGTPR